MDINKKCAECGLVKPLSNFHKCKKNKDGYSVWCIKCKKEYRENYTKKKKKIILYKICNLCNKEKPIKEFYKNSDTKDGYLNRCKECFKYVMSLHNKKPESKERIKLWARQYRETDKGKIVIKKIYKKAQENGYYKKYQRKDSIKSYSQKWHMNKYNNDSTYKLNNLMSKRIYFVLRNGKNYKSWKDLVGYDVTTLKKHLEKKFKKGMNWNNLGKWHIDHIIPVSLWKFKTYNDREFKQCWSLCNLQPLWAHENQKKGARIEIPRNN